MVVQTGRPLNGYPALQNQPGDSTSTTLKLNSARSGDTIRPPYTAVLFHKFPPVGMILLSVNIHLNVGVFTLQGPWSPLWRI
jgi:hypothetical protein